MCVDSDISELLYKQYGAGTWIKRQLTCACNVVLYDVGVMSFQLRDRTKLPEGVNRVLKAPLTEEKQLAN